MDERASKKVVIDVGHGGDDPELAGMESLRKNTL